MTRAQQHRSRRGLSAGVSCLWAALRNSPSLQHTAQTLMHTLRSCSSQLPANISLWITVGWAHLLPKAIPQTPMSPETKATARRKKTQHDDVHLPVLAPRRVAAGARTAQFLFQVTPVAQAYTFLAAGLGSAPGSASGVHPGLDKKVADTHPSATFH